MAFTPWDGAVNTTVFYWLSIHYSFQQTTGGFPPATITIQSPVEFDRITGGAGKEQT
jgi:hypothetical protein